MTKEAVEGTPRFVPHNLSGKESGPKRDMVLMNAGATLADNKGDGIGAAREAIPSGAAVESANLVIHPVISGEGHLILLEKSVSLLGEIDMKSACPDFAEITWAELETRCLSELGAIGINQVSLKKAPDES